MGQHLIADVRQVAVLGPKLLVTLNGVQRDANQTPPVVCPYTLAGSIAPTLSHELPH